jgi:glyoxylase-like metal-dependent hydrolase (beta-lactamase superfamily II)
MNGIIKRVVGVVAVACCLVAAWAAREAAPPEMKFNDVKEIAPGVFFRYSSISATDMSVPFGGCNNTWVVFKEFVVVIDANFPKEAEDVIAAIRKTTDKPIRYVFDTHHHGDHAYGNTVWAKAGAKRGSRKGRRPHANTAPAASSAISRRSCAKPSSAASQAATHWPNRL